MIFDSLASLLLFLSCVSAWALAAPVRAAVRTNIRFAAMLFAALSVARALELILPQFVLLAASVALIALSLGAIALALGMFAFLVRPLPAGAAALALGLSLGAGLGASLSGEAAYAFGCVIPGVLLVMAAALSAYAANPFRAALTCVAALSLMLGGFALMGGAIPVTEMFFATALLAAVRASQIRASQKRVEIERGRRGLSPIGFRG
jgi:hypothetical protein